jgi:hypothetical protein
LFLLGALLLWIRFTETGEARWYVSQWVVFVFGFGALELNLVYPALAALYALCFARRYLMHTVPMFLVSAAFVVVHRMAAPPVSEDIYRMYFDSSVFSGLGTFLAWSFSAHRYAAFRDLELWPFYAAAAFAAFTLCILAVWLISRRNWLPVFCIGWFLVAIAPVLPLKNQRTDYYVTIPVIGLAILGAYGMTIAWRKPWSRAVALVAILAYVLPGAWMARGMSRALYEHSARVKHLVRGLAGASEQHPGKVLIISGVDNALFWRAWHDPLFRSLDLRYVYLAQSMEPEIIPMRGARLTRFFLPDTIACDLLKQRKARVYEVIAGGRLKDTTALTLAHLERRVLKGPGYLDVRSPLTALHVGEGWWPAEANHRWMSKEAVVELRGPEAKSGELVLRGFVAPEHVSAGPVLLSVSVDGNALTPAKIDSHNLTFDLRLPLPAAVLGKPLVRVELAVDRPLVIPGDGRELGPAFGTFEVRP